MAVEKQVLLTGGRHFEFADRCISFLNTSSKTVGYCANWHTASPAFRGIICGRRGGGGA